MMQLRQTTGFQMILAFWLDDTYPLIQQNAEFHSKMHPRHDENVFCSKAR